MKPGEPNAGPMDEENGPEEVQVLTVRDNRLYLPRDVRLAFNLKNGDRVVIYREGETMSVKILRRQRRAGP